MEVAIVRNRTHVGHFDPRRARRLGIFGTTAQGVEKYGRGEWRELFEVSTGNLVIVSSRLSEATFDVKEYGVAEFVDRAEVEEFLEQHTTLFPGELWEVSLVDFTPATDSVPSSPTGNPIATHLAGIGVVGVESNPIATTETGAEVVAAEPNSVAVANPEPQGPFAPGCLRIGSTMESGIGRKQFSLLVTLWDAQKACPPRQNKCPDPSAGGVREGLEKVAATTSPPRP